MNKVLLHYGKHGVSVYNADTEEKLCKSCFKILEQTFDYTGYYYDVSGEVEKILLEEDMKAAKRFIFDRNGYEYEGVELVTVI